VVAVLVLGVGIAVAISLGGSTAGPPLTQARPDRGLSLSQAQLKYLALAEQGVSQTPRWWDSSAGWYLDRLHDHGRSPLATLWDSNGLFEALDEIAIAQPTKQNLDAVRRFAKLSERYLNRQLKPTPGYASYPGDSNPHSQTWYDDNGWIGLGFLDAYRATGTAAYLADAERAFRFIAAGGWDAADGGGMWWSTTHPWRSGEALAAAADLAASLYQSTRNPTYLKAANTYIGWANQHLLQPHGVYLRTANTPYPYLIEPKTPVPRRPTPTQHATNFAGKCPRGPGGCKPGAAVRMQGPAPGHGQPSNATPTMVAMPHDGEGAMLAAVTTLCETTGKGCRAAEKLAGATTVWLAPFADGPQYDSVLVRGLLTLYAHDHNARWYRFAVDIARLITTHARTAPGVYLQGWDGRPVPGSAPGMLRTDAGSLGVFADLAGVAPPS
jgi:uncharacterized protein YyaL (SSP411 family)